MSALGHKQTRAVHKPMSALPPKADICRHQAHVRFVPEADIREIAWRSLCHSKRRSRRRRRGFLPIQPHGVSYLSWVEMLVNLPLSVVPIVLTVAIITTEMPAAMSPYSIEVRRIRLSKRKNLRHITNSLLLFLRSRRNARINKKPCDDAVWTSRLYRDFSDAQGKSAKVFTVAT